MSYWCEDNIPSFKYGGMYSSGLYVGGLYLAENKKYSYSLFECYGLVYLIRERNKGFYNRKRWRILSFWDVEIIKSCLLNSGCEVNWETYNLTREIFNRMNKNGYNVCGNTDYCNAEVVKPFMDI